MTARRFFHFKYPVVKSADTRSSRDDDGKLPTLRQIVHSVSKYHKKVSFNIASEVSYVYILSGQKFIKNAKDSQF